MPPQSVFLNFADSNGDLSSFGSKPWCLKTVKDSTQQTLQCLNWVALKEQKQFSMVEDMHKHTGTDQNKKDA